ncbi:ABC transporter substrate-binding protein [Burkholderia sp. BCC1988]|uniref:ABC transporter substrate-binding protein n=1 Tax=Burkholderia sp. BCC1988 TaxID=2817443 RepID=UPI002AAF45B0|nr:ABC transporter substrate-binding protein [Burkholderia sp. BCC1988]
MSSVLGLDVQAGTIHSFAVGSMGRENFLTRRRVLLAGGATALALKMRPSFSATDVPRIVFLNPGESTERASGKQWQLVSRFMAAAAKTLSLNLEVRYAERDHLLMLRQAEALARSHAAPDYIVIVNEKQMAPQMLTILSASGSRIVVIHNDLTDAQRKELGNERERIANWIGTVTADASSAGYRLMAYLAERQTNNVPRVIGVTGDPITPVSVERAHGVQEWIMSTPAARLNQLVFSDWTFGDSYEKTRILLKRYPATNLIWAANDAMTLGAKKACDAVGSAATVGGMGALPEALQSVAHGELTAMMAGDYFIGAFAMVLIHDYHHGLDFAAHGTARLKLDFLTLVHRGNAAAYYEMLFGGRGDPDFSTISRFHRRAKADYDFSVKRLLNNMGKPSDVTS